MTKGNNGLAPYLTRRSINGDVSDLFFNRDLENCRQFSRGAFTGWDDKRLREEAKYFLDALSRLGVTTPTVDDLIADFYNRV